MSSDNIDFQMGAVAHVSHFGALKTSPTWPVLRANFPGSSLDTSLWSPTTANGGNVQVNNGVGRLYTSTATAGSVKLHSVGDGLFEAGQVTVYQSGVYAGTPVAGNIRRWGLMDSGEQNGLFFELNGEDFRVVARKGGVDSAVEQAGFSGNDDFTPGASNNTYRIHYSAGRAIFQRSRRGNISTLHVMTNSDFPLVNDLNLGLYYENTNTGNDTDIELRVRGASSSIFGQLETSRALGTISDSSVATLTKAIITGRDGTGNYQNLLISEDGALLVSDFLTEVTRGNIAGQSVITKFGRNPQIDTTTDPEDVWGGGGVYTGFPSETETLEVFSSSANDAAAGTGARTVEIGLGLDENFEQVPPVVVTLNGTTPVTIPTTTYSRAQRLVVLTAGSTGANEGTITVRHTTTTANVFMVVPTGLNQSSVACFTIPAGKTGYLSNLEILMARGNGSAGSAEVSLRVRPPGGVFNAKRHYTITDGIMAKPNLEAPLTIEAQSDIKVTVESVSDNATVVSAEFRVLLIDN